MTPQKSDIPNFKGYGDAMQYQAEQAAKKKGAKPKTETKESPAPEKAKETEKAK